MMIMIDDLEAKEMLQGLMSVVWYDVSLTLRPLLERSQQYPYVDTVRV